jgi:hypothetical protein
VLQQALAAGLLDVIAVRLVPVFLGAGVRGFDNIFVPDPGLQRCAIRVRPFQANHVQLPGATGELT